MPYIARRILIKSLSPIPPPKSAIKTLGKTERQACEPNGLQAIADTAPSRWFSDDLIQNNPKIVKNLSNTLAKGDKDGYANCCQALAIADLRDELKNAKTPLLVIAGEQDPVTTVADGQFIVDNAPNARLVTLNASHISNIEQADEFTKAIKDFLTKT